MISICLLKSGNRNLVSQDMLLKSCFVYMFLVHVCGAHIFLERVYKMSALHTPDMLEIDLINLWFRFCPPANRQFLSG